MTCSIVISEGTFKRYQNAKARAFVSPMDYDEAFGNFRVVIEPMDCYRKDADDDTTAPTFYYEKTEGGYRIEGEGYIITSDFRQTILGHKNDVTEKWGDTPIQWLALSK